MMSLSAKGLAHIKRWEGCRLEAYQDGAGVWTIGYGHTAAAGSPIPRAGLTITQQRADEILARDLRRYEDAVRLAIKRTASQSEFDAIVSLCFNIGPAAFAKSTMLRRFNAGDTQGAAEALTWWNKITRNGRKVVSQGLVNRRKAERALFLSPEPKDAAATIATSALIGGTSVSSIVISSTPSVWWLAAAAAAFGLVALAVVYRRRIAAVLMAPEAAPDDEGTVR